MVIEAIQVPQTAVKCRADRVKRRDARRFTRQQIHLIDYSKIPSCRFANATASLASKLRRLTRIEISTVIPDSSICVAHISPIINLRCRAGSLSDRLKPALLIGPVITPHLIATTSGIRIIPATTTLAQVVSIGSPSVSSALVVPELSYTSNRAECIFFICTLGLNSGA